MARMCADKTKFKKLIPIKVKIDPLFYHKERKERKYYLLIFRLFYLCDLCDLCG